MWHGSGTKPASGKAYPGSVSESRQPAPPPASPSPTLDELGARAGARPIVDASELAADIWESDEELDEFIADVRKSRNSSLA